MRLRMRCMGHCKVVPLANPIGDRPADANAVAGACIAPLQSEIMTTTHIINGTLLHPYGTEQADIVINDGHIAAIAAPGELPMTSDAQVLDVAGQLVMAGAIDIHFHCRTPGHDRRGDFYTETRAAAAGGVTTVFEMPISVPGCATPATFANRRGYIERQAIIDVALYGAPGTRIRDDVHGMAEMGAIAFKIFTHRAPMYREDEFVGICLTGDADLYDSLKLTKETGRRLVIHCESDDLLEAGIARMRAAGRGDLASHFEARPPIVETTAIARMLTMAEDLGAPIHIAHVSTAQGVDLVYRAKAAGIDVTAETCPHYLFLTDEDYLRIGPCAKVNPPIRGKEHQAALWDGLRNGTLDVVSTDHSTFQMEEKNRGWDDIVKSPSGCEGVQTLVPLLMTAALRDKKLALTDVPRLIAATPAKLFNLPKKGRIVVGNDADLCIYDPRTPHTLTQDQLFSKSKEIDILFAPMPMQGKVTHTLSRGRLVFQNHQVLAEAGSGRFLPSGGN